MGRPACAFGTHYESCLWEKKVAGRWSSPDEEFCHWAGGVVRLGFLLPEGLIEPHYKKKIINDDGYFQDKVLADIQVKMYSTRQALYLIFKLLMPVGAGIMSDNFLLAFLNCVHTSCSYEITVILSQIMQR